MSSDSMFDGAARDAILKGLGQVASSLTREHIQQTINTYCMSYNLQDTEGRLALFSDSVIFEDPAGLRCASDKSQLRAFFTGFAQAGMRLQMVPERVIVIGDEAIAVISITVQINEGEPALLNVIAHYVFGVDGLIASQRIFFDEDCVALVPATNDAGGGKVLA